MHRQPLKKNLPSFLRRYQRSTKEWLAVVTMINRVSDYEAKPGLHASLASYYNSLEQHLSDLNIHVLSGGKTYLLLGTFHIMKDLSLVYRLCSSLCLVIFVSIGSFEN